MAVKTNYKMNGKEYYRISASFGRNSEGKLIRKFFYGKSKKEAEKKLEEYKFSLKEGMALDSNVRFSKTMKSWLWEYIKNNVKDSCFDRYECTFSCHLEKCPFSNKYIKDITSLDVQRYYNDLYKNGSTYATICRINKLLKRFLKYCITEGYIIRNPCDNIKLPGIERSTKDEVDVFTKEELKLIINHKCNRTIKPIALVSLSTGMRQGEILGLKWSDIDFENKEIHIERTLSAYCEIINGKRKFTKTIQSPKTKNSIRTIPLPDSLIDVFKEVKVKQNKNKLLHGDRYNRNNEEYVFLSREGELLSRTCVLTAWKIYLKNCNVRYLKFHALRHTYATLQFENDIPLKTISLLLGHSSISTTADIYTHVMKKQKNKATDIINVLKMC